MAQPQQSGLEPENEVKAHHRRRDTRPQLQRIKEDILFKPEAASILMFVIGAAAMISPTWHEYIVVFGILLFLYIRSSFKHYSLPFRMPMSTAYDASANEGKGRSGIIDPEEINPATDKPTWAKGISHFGNRKKDDAELWFNNDDLRTHILIFGSTGSGKTVALVSMAYNALMQGSGFIFVDGKGDASLFATIFSMSRAMGREDDFLIINFGTGSRDIEGPQLTKLSNTINPFAFGASDALTQLLVGLMGDSGGSGDMWKGRAISLLTGLMIALVSLRDAGRILLDVEVIRDFMQLKYIVALSNGKNPIDGTPIKLSDRAQAAIKAYLSSLPGFVEKKGADQSATTLEQHGYLQMQFTRVLGSLSDTLGHIFKTNLGEVDLYDVVVNRRILVVLLPALEKSQDELANLGKVVIMSLKNMMAATLGAQMEGSKMEVLDNRPTNAPSPFVTILDEYGAYAVPGVAVMPAQARSLGFSMVFASQDMPGFEKASKEDAASIAANCNIKIFMKLEDAERTYEIFEKSVGMADVMVMGGMQASTNGMSTNYMDNMNATMEQRSRGSLQDLKEQTPGEAHILFKSRIIRARMFSCGMVDERNLLSKYRLNHFIKVKPPAYGEMAEWDLSPEALKKKTDAAAQAEAAKKAVIAEEVVASANAPKVAEQVTATPSVESKATATQTLPQTAPDADIKQRTARALFGKRTGKKKATEQEFDGAVVSIFGRNNDSLDDASKVVVAPWAAEVQAGMHEQLAPSSAYEIGWQTATTLSDLYAMEEKTGKGRLTQILIDQDHTHAALVAMDMRLGVDPFKAKNDADHLMKAIVANASYACQPTPARRSGKSSLIEAFSKKYAAR
ncbi:type IV secretory system conjugative DNA transfer family protein [Undibacterium sp. Ji83W]|uniref:type IV secretory system conjugative DNA transfer family protein n=1 Tax=Undibacterium sp. Ji83W TaxID=3413043 RepID=UPI003BEFAA0C